MKILYLATILREKGDAFIFQNKTLTNPVGNTGYSIKKETILFTRVTGP